MTASFQSFAVIRTLNMDRKYFGGIFWGILLLIDTTYAGCVFHAYPHSALYGFNDKVIKHVERFQCEESCQQETSFTCISYDYAGDTSRCFLSSESRMTQPKAFGKHGLTNYYEKECGDDIKQEFGSGDESGDGIDCATGWISHKESCYKFVIGRDKIWQDAQQMCAQGNYGGHLVAIDNEEEFQFVTSQIIREIPGTGFELFWTSGRRKSNDAWVWVTGTNWGEDLPIHYVNWYSGEPNNDRGREDAMNLLYKNGVWGYNDAYPMDRIRYVCEYED